MTTKIQLLSQQTINQIAAGEVIENPSSLIKELVENALDAGATKIVVEILGGGLQLVKVVDDGSGMGPDDALLSLERHATSKIREAEDLIEVATMGFRGEALASIAAISKMTLQTSLAEGPGTEIVIEGGELKRNSVIARNQGTTIEVRQLFYNVPARRKFQKAPNLCTAEITKVLVSLSLAHPFTAFELYQQEVEILKLPRESSLPFLEALKKRAGQVLGEDFLEGCTPLECSCPPFSFRGILGSFQNTRPNRTLQYQFINERAVLCPALSYAVKDAFGTRIDEGRFPAYVIHLDIPKDYVDVNVHPQKREIRLREEKWVKQKIQEKIEETFYSLDKGASPLSSAPISFNLFSERSFFSKPEEKVYDSPLLEKAALAYEPLYEQPAFVFEERPRPIGLYKHFLWVEAASVPSLGMSSEGLLFMDLKEAGAQVLFESLKGKTIGKEKQQLLVPITLSCTVDEAEEISSALDELDSLGFSLEKGRQCFLVEAIPPSLDEEEVVEFIRDFIFSGEKGESREQRRQRQLAVACHKLSSNKRKEHTLLSAVALLSALLKTSSPKISPLGEKIIISVDADDLQRLFLKKK